MREKSERMVVPLTKRGGLAKEAGSELRGKSDFHSKHLEHLRYSWDIQ